MSQTASHDVLVVGGGAIGLACALALRVDGHTVCVIDQAALGSGSSHGNCGTVTPSHAPPLAAPGIALKALRWMLRPDAPLYVPPRADPVLWRWLWRVALRGNPRDWRVSAQAKAALLHDSRDRLESWIAHHRLDCGFVASGDDYVFRDQRLFEAELRGLPLLRELGITAEAVHGDAYLAREPALKPGLAGAVCFDGDAMLRPDRYVAELARVFGAAGGEVREHVALQGLVRERDGWRAHTSSGALQARQVVIAAGAWSPLLARQLDLRWLRHAVQPGKGYSITYDRPDTVPRRPLVLRDCSVCVTAWDDGFRLGSTMEFSGHAPGLNAVRLAALERGAADFLRQPIGPVVRERWFGWRPMCVDDVPIIGAAPGKAGLWLATGHGMMGIGMSPGTGQLLADLVAGRSPAIDPVPYSPLRFV